MVFVFVFLKDQAYRYSSRDTCCSFSSLNIYIFKTTILSCVLDVFVFFFFYHVLLRLTHFQSILLRSGELLEGSFPWLPVFQLVFFLPEGWVGSVIDQTRLHGFRT